MFITQANEEKHLSSTGCLAVQAMHVHPTATRTRPSPRSVTLNPIRSRRLGFVAVLTLGRQLEVLDRCPPAPAVLRAYDRGAARRFLDCNFPLESVPFLFKVLSVEKTLSVQVHPTEEVAKLFHSKYSNIYPSELLIGHTPM